MVNAVAGGQAVSSSPQMVDMAERSVSPTVSPAVSPAVSLLPDSSVSGFGLPSASPSVQRSSQGQLTAGGKVPDVPVGAASAKNGEAGKVSPLPLPSTNSSWWNELATPLPSVEPVSGQLFDRRWLAAGCLPFMSERAVSHEGKPGWGLGCGPPIPPVDKARKNQAVWSGAAGVEKTLAAIFTPPVEGFLAGFRDVSDRVDETVASQLVDDWLSFGAWPAEYGQTGIVVAISGQATPGQGHWRWDGSVQVSVADRSGRVISGQVVDDMTMVGQPGGVWVITGWGAVRAK
jgi:hypothetical protein